MAEQPSFGFSEQGYRGVRTLYDLSDDSMERLLTALENTLPTSVAPKYATRVSRQVNENSEDMREVVRFILSLYDLRSQVGLSLSDFLQAVRRSLANSKEEDVKALTDDWERLENRLKSVLSLERTTGVVAKAQTLMTQQGNVFLGARVLTDVRPIFTADPEQEPAAALLVHQLAITYRHDDEDRHFYVALDSDDVEKLRTVLNRAESKGKSLVSALKETSMAVLEDES
jgi:hypothetical protein